MDRKKRKKKIPCDMVTLERLHEKKSRKSRRTQFLRLDHSDPEKLLRLIRSLYDDSTVPQQIKVNYYLQTETNSSLSFLIEKSKLFPDYVIKVIGTKWLKNEVRFEGNSEFLKRLRNTRIPTEIMKDLLDENLKNEIDTILDDNNLPKDAKCLLIPIYQPYLKNKILYACLVKHDHPINEKARDRGIVGECFRYCQEIIVNTMRYEEQKLFHSTEKEILQTAIKNMGQIDNFPLLISAIKRQICKFLCAERCNIFLLNGKMLASHVCEHGVSYETYRKDVRDVNIPVGVGVSGTVAQTGKIINVHNPKKHPLYRHDLDIESGLVTRNMLCFPLILYGKVFGVAEAVNKANGYLFTGADISHAIKLGKLYGIQLHMSLRDKKNTDDLSRRSIIDNFMIEIPKRIDAKKYSSYKSMKGALLLDDEIDTVLNCRQKHNYETFATYMFITSSIPESHQPCYCLYMFEEQNLLKKLDIDRESFLRFLLNVKLRFADFSLHNWKNAFNTLHFTYTIVKKEKILESNTITVLETFCLFLAAICHEMEYSGSVTPYTPTCGTTLGSLYSSPGSVVQLHSTAQTIRLLSSCNITDSFDFEKYREFLNLFDTMMLDTDLGNHVYCRDSIKKLIEDKTILVPPNRRHYFGIILICSEISDFSRPWEYLEQRGTELSQEFYSPEVTQDCYGVVEFSEILDNPEVKKIQLQSHFIQTICIPAFNLLTFAFPRIDGCLENLELNMKYLNTKKERVIIEQLEALTN